MALVRDLKVETAAELALDDGHVTEGIRAPHEERTHTHKGLVALCSSEWVPSSSVVHMGARVMQEDTQLPVLARKKSPCP